MKMWKLLLALLLWGVPVVAHASCAQILGGDDAGGCVEIDSCGGDACLGDVKGVYIDPVYDGTPDGPIVAIGLTSDELIGAVLHIAQKVPEGVADLRMTVPETGHETSDGTVLTMQGDVGFSIFSNEPGVNGNIELFSITGVVEIGNASGSATVQADGDTAVTDDLEITGNIDMMTDLSDIRDAAGFELMTFDSVPSAVNEMTLANAATGGSPTLSATGSDTNISMTLAPKGTGGIDLNNGGAPLLLRLLTSGTLRGTMRASVFASNPLMDFISGSTLGKVRILNSSETVGMMDCDDGLNDACTFQATRLVPQTTMPTCNSGFEGAISYDGDGAVNGPCVCVELVATVYTWTPLLATAADCS